MRKVVETVTTTSWQDGYGTVTRTTRERKVVEDKGMEPGAVYVYDHEATMANLTDEDLARITGFDHG